MTEPSTGGWGEAEGPSSAQSIPRTVDLGSGARLELNPEAIRALADHPAVVAARAEKAAELAAVANMLAVHVGRKGRPEPHYASGKSRVWPDNFAAVLDDAQHATLLKTMANAGAGSVLSPVEQEQARHREGPQHPVHEHEPEHEPEA